MRLSIFVSILAVAAVPVSMAADTKEPTAPPPPKPPAQSSYQFKDTKSRGEEYYKQCMEDWDKATHMSKQDWARTCRRVSGERMKFLLERGEQ